MKRSSTILRLLSWLLLLIIFAGQCQNKKPEVIQKSAMLLKAGAFLDTLKYDDGNLTKSFSTAFGDTFGVWFSPPKGIPCSLVGIQSFFGGSVGSQNDKVVGFVKSTLPYNNKDSLRYLDSSLVNFQMLPRPRGQATTIFFNQNNSIVVDTSKDFFIGWVVDSVKTQVLPVGLGDSTNYYTPSRSYRRQLKDSTFIPLQTDLGVRAIFECLQVPPDSGNFTFELLWNTRNTDLDLYLILPVAGDTIYWDNKKNTKLDGFLDVDDNNGYGPEKIMQRYRPTFEDISAQLYVNYYGPANGKVTKSTVLIHRNGTQPFKIGPCDLRPKFSNWWHVATINLQNGNFVADTCNVSSNLKLIQRLKH